MLIKNLKSKIIGTQKQFAAKLADRESKLSSRKKKLMLVLFCFLFGVCSIYVIIAAITKRYSASELQEAPITIPYHIGRNFHQPGAVIDGETYKRVENFKHYLDSLKMNSPGRYTEIMNTRPHLYDSILAFEKIYSSQSKK